MAKIAILLKLMSNDFSIGCGVGEIDHDQVRLKPMRSMNGEGGIVFFANGVFAGAFKSPAHRASDARLVIDQKNFFQDLHEIASDPSIGYASSWRWPVRRTHRISRAPVNQRKLDTVLRVSARITVLKPNDNIPCSRTSRRISRDVTFTSETWQVMPMTNEK